MHACDAAAGAELGWVKMVNLPHNRDLFWKFNIYPYCLQWHSIIIDYIKFQVLKQNFERYETAL